MRSEEGKLGQKQVGINFWKKRDLSGAIRYRLNLDGLERGEES